MLAYRLPQKDDVDLNELSDLIRPQVELELQVSERFYINALTAYAECRGQRLGTKLLEATHTLGSEAGCEELSLKVFELSEGVVRRYERHRHGPLSNS